MRSLFAEPKPEGAWLATDALSTDTTLYLPYGADKDRVVL